MNPSNPAAAAHSLPRHIAVMASIYFAASLLHFAHNAEFIAFYPGMPGWLTREKVYLAWLGVTAVGALAWFFGRKRLPLLAAPLIGIYGALGIDGLAHYTLALCSEHTLMTNFTIWFEVITGAALLLAGGLWAGQLITQRQLLKPTA
ncbi:MAG: hypothetical protein HC765_12505 [Brachymonas sp.]|nr:hypothetical protein [Brachymonas sp.]